MIEHNGQKCFFFNLLTFCNKLDILTNNDGLLLQNFCSGRSFNFFLLRYSSSTHKMYKSGLSLQCLCFYFECAVFPIQLLLKRNKIFYYEIYLFLRLSRVKLDFSPIVYWSKLLRFFYKILLRCLITAKKMAPYKIDPV